MRTAEGPEEGKSGKPREDSGSNCLANFHFSLRVILILGKHKTRGERGHGRRQFVGCRDLRDECQNEIIKFRVGASSKGEETLDAYPCGFKFLDETVKVEE